MGCLPYNRLSHYLFLEELRQAEASRAFREAHRCSALEGDVEQRVKTRRIRVASA